MDSHQWIRQDSLVEQSQNPAQRQRSLARGVVTPWIPLSPQALADGHFLLLHLPSFSRTSVPGHHTHWRIRSLTESSSDLVFGDKLMPKQKESNIDMVLIQKSYQYTQEQKEQHLVTDNN